MLALYLLCTYRTVYPVYLPTVFADEIASIVVQFSIGHVKIVFGYTTIVNFEFFSLEAILFQVGFNSKTVVWDF